MIYLIRGAKIVKLKVYKFYGKIQRQNAGLILSDLLRFQAESRLNSC